MVAFDQALSTIKRAGPRVSAWVKMDVVSKRLNPEDLCTIC
jgi:hypothetical protein